MSTLRLVIAFLLLSPIVWGQEPRIVGPVTVNVGNPPWVELTLQDAPEGAVLHWSGPIGAGQVGFYTRDGVGISTTTPGQYRLRCRIQVPVDGLDPVVDLETTVVVVGTGPTPEPDPPEPTPDPDDGEPGWISNRFAVAGPLWREASKVQSPTRPAEARQLSKWFSEAAVQTTASDIMAHAQSEAGKAFSAAQKRAWDAWTKAYVRECNKLRDAGKLDSDADLRQLMFEISQALFAVQ